jgi:integrase
MDFANFLAFLGQTLKLSVSSVRCHRAAISTTIKQAGGPSFSEDQLLKDVTKALALDCVTTARRVPLWDLSIVLKALSTDPFEPILSVPLKFLTYKTIFLLTLALGRRGSEIHGLSGLSGDTRFEQDGSVSVRFLPEFLAKNQNPEHSHKPLTVKSLLSLGDQEDVDITLCPVRALKAYLERSKSVRHRSLRRLFVSLNAGYEKDLGKATLARWLVETIKLAYAKAGLDPLSTRPHEIRAIAASLAASHNVALAAILDAAYWKSENSFISFYLRDISSRDESGRRRLPVVVAAQQVLR